MKNKKGLIIVLAVILVIGIIFFFKFHKQPIEKIYLSDSYYNQEGVFVEKDHESIQELKEETYILYIYNSYCSFPIPCDSIFQEFMTNYQINFISMPFAEFKKTDFYPSVKYAPSIIVIQKEKIIAYLDADSDEDTDKYQDVEALKNWLEKYIYFHK